LEKLYGSLNVSSMSTSWADVLQADSRILGLRAASDVWSSMSGMFLAGVLSDGAAAVDAPSVFVNLTKDLGPSLAELAFTGAAVHDAASLLTQATREFQAIENSLSTNRNTAISYDSIKAAIDHTLISLNTGDAATQAAGRIPVISQDIWDDI